MKTATKTAKSPRNGAEIPLGAHPGNTGGKKGRSGRRSQKLGLFLKELRESPDAQSALKAAATDETNRNFGNVWKLAADYDDEKPAKKLEVTEPLSTAERHSRIQRVIDRVMGKAS